MAALALSDYRRLVVKVGSSLLVDETGELNRRWLESLALDIAGMQDDSHEILIVSSGAIALGSSVLGINKKRARLPDLQAAAAAGQVQLVRAYQEVLEKHRIRGAQILLTPEDTENRRRFLNARSTFGRLLELSVVPIVNENDTVATEEIRYGDNDRLAARVAQLVMADALILLSDVDGLYSSDPGTDPNATLVPEVRAISSDILATAGESRSDYGSGGMATKVLAARIATHAGCSTIIASGTVENPLQNLADGGRHTIFRPEGTPAAARKQWLAGVLEVRGEIRIDNGAAKALQDGNSLLPVGVIQVDGKFRRGDVVTVTGPNGTEIGRGLAEYSDEDAARLKGCQSDEIEDRLGYRGRSVMIHRDELVLFDSEN
ncbi:MAG: glutamate 5-kinase [Woeseiaceae bacterium]